jgi:hypothetical protein
LESILTLLYVLKEIILFKSILIAVALLATLTGCGTSLEEAEKQAVQTPMGHIVDMQVIPGENGGIIIRTDGGYVVNIQRQNLVLRVGEDATLKIFTNMIVLYTPSQPKGVLIQYSLNGGIPT